MSVDIKYKKNKKYRYRYQNLRIGGIEKRLIPTRDFVVFQRELDSGGVPVLAVSGHRLPAAYALEVSAPLSGDHLQVRLSDSRAQHLPHCHRTHGKSLIW